MNTSHYETTRKLTLNIKANLNRYFILDNLANFIWGNYPIIFYDEVTITRDIKQKIQKELSYVNISKLSLFPDLESSAKELCKKFEHLQPLIILKRDNDLIVYHIDESVKTDLKIGDIIVYPEFKTVNEFWGRFVIQTSLPIKVRRKSDNDETKELSFEINCYDFSTKDNPLFANFSDH